MMACGDGGWVVLGCDFGGWLWGVTTLERERERERERGIKKWIIFSCDVKKRDEM